MNCDRDDAPLHDFIGADWSTNAYPRGVELFQQRQFLDEVFFIKTGTVKLQYVGHTGAESILGLAFAGQWLGTAPTMARRASPVSAITCSVVSVKRMPARAFRALLDNHPEWSLQMHQMHSAELCRQLGWTGQMNGSDSRDRLRRVIRQFIDALRVQNSGRGFKLLLPLHQWELAKLLAVTPEHLCRLLKDIQQQGLIRREKGWIVVPDVQRLCPDSEWSEAACFSAPADAG